MSLCIIFATSLFTASYVEKNPRQGWWQHNYTVSDLGVDGYLFSVLQKIIIPQHLSGDMAYAKSTINSTSTLPLAYDEVTQEVSTTIENDSPENYYDYLKYYLKKLNHSYATHTNEVEIPNFASSSPHILIYQLESIGSWGINNDPSPMSYFKQFMQDNIHVDHFFANGCHTIDAEFVTLCGFFPDPGTAIADVGTDIEYNECLPNLLKREKGYQTAVFHVNDKFFWNRHILDPKWGFDNFFFAPDAYPDQKLDDFIPLGKAVEYIKKSEVPVFAQVIGMVSHTYHTEKDLQKIEKESNVSIPRFTQKIDPDLVSQNEDLDEQQMREYFAYLTAVDNDIKGLFEMLEKEQILDNTIVIIVNDHRLYNFPEVDRTNFYLYNEIPFAMYVPEMGSVQARDIASHIDIAPSILDLVMGKNYRKPENFLGTSIFSKDHPNYALSTCNNRVNYVNSNEIIIGDRAVNQYVSIWQDTQMGEYEVTKIGNAVQTITSMIKSMIRGNLLVNR
jgi:phosphoglycerol transferase MdoB-like AlkP superfamily enzyme